MSYAAQRASFVVALYGLSSVFNDEQVVLFLQFQDFVHVTGNAGKMNHDDCFGFGRNQAGKLVFIDAGMILAAVGKNQFCAPEYKGFSGRDKRIGMQNQFITFLNVNQECAHFQGIGVRCIQLRFAKSLYGFKESMAFFGKRSVTGYFS